MRGRRRDSADAQAAKGDPRKRGAKVTRARADKLAALLAAPQESSDPLAPPALLTDPRCAHALAVWREYAPRLARNNLLVELDRLTFAMFCVYYGEFIEATQDIRDKGKYFLVKMTFSEDTMPRANPSVAIRDKAWAVVMEMSKRFGLTPLDRYSLTAQQASALGNGGGLFDHAQKPAAESPAAAPDDLVGSLGSFDSPPPRTLQ